MSKKIKKFFNFIFNIPFNPGQSLGDAMNRKYWLPVLAFLLGTLAFLFFFQFPGELQRMTENARISGQFTNEQLLYFQGSPIFARFMTTILKLLGITLNLAVGAFFVYLFFGIGGSRGHYVNFFSLVTGASVLDTLFPSLLRTLSIFLNTDLSRFLNLSFFFTGLSPSSYIAILLGNISLFSVWYLFAIASGVSNFSKLNLQKCIILSLLYFMFKVIIQAAFSYLLIKIAIMPGI